MKTTEVHVSTRVWNGKKFEVIEATFKITNPKFMDSLVCPKCGVTEVHPFKPDSICIRGYKVDDYSQCLVCAGYYDPKTLEVRPENERPEKWKEGGWFQ